MLYKVRQTKNLLFMSACVIALVLLCVTLLSMLWTLISEGISGFSFSLFTQMTPPPGQAGGLLNAIYGSFVMTLLATIIATPIGILTAIYLTEFNLDRKIGSIIRFVNDVLLSAPSIIVGLFFYAILVAPMKHFSALAGALAMAMIALPVIVRTSEDMIHVVPNALRESASALGAPYYRVIFKIVLPSIYHGIITGILLAIARILGETAPLLFTSLNNQFWSTSLNKPIASLPIVIFQYAMSPYPQWQSLAWAGALLITLGVGVLTFISRVLIKSRSHS